MKMKAKSKALSNAKGDKKLDTYMEKRRVARKTGSHVMYKSK